MNRSGTTLPSSYSIKLGQGDVNEPRLRILVIVSTDIMSFSTIYPSPSKIDGVRPGNQLGLNGDVSYDHTISSPEQVLHVGNGINEQFYRVDTLGLKKRLLSSIGGEEEASEYWQSLAQFLKGKMRRDEFETLVKPVLNTSLKRMLMPLCLSIEC